MSLVTQLADLTTRIATEVKALRTLINGNAVDLTSLTTTAKTNLVAALNELDAAVDALAAGSGAISDGTTSTTTTWSSTKTSAEIVAAISALIAGAPGILDTLAEIAAQLATDESAVGALTTAVAGKQPLDADLTAIAALTSAANKVLYATGADAWALADFTAAGRALVGDADAAAQRATLAVYATTEIGDPTTNFVTTFNAGLV
jgi:hypothetical protein